MTVSHKRRRQLAALGSLAVLVGYFMPWMTMPSGTKCSSLTRSVSVPEDVFQNSARLAGFDSSTSHGYEVDAKVLGFVVPNALAFFAALSAALVTWLPGRPAEMCPRRVVVALLAYSLADVLFLGTAILRCSGAQIRPGVVVMLAGIAITVPGALRHAVVTTEGLGR